MSKCIFEIEEYMRGHATECYSCPFIKWRDNYHCECIERTTRFLCIEESHFTIPAFDGTVVKQQEVREVVDAKKFEELYGEYELKICAKEGYTGDAIGQKTSFRAWRLWKQYPDYESERAISAKERENTSDRS